MRTTSTQSPGIRTTSIRTTDMQSPSVWITNVGTTDMQIAGLGRRSQGRVFRHFSGRNRRNPRAQAAGMLGTQRAGAFDARHSGKRKRPTAAGRPDNDHDVISGRGGT